MRTFTGLVLLMAMLEASPAHAGIGELDFLPDCDACGPVAFGVLGGALLLGTHAFFFKELASGGPSLTTASIVMLIEHTVLGVAASVFLADALIQRRDAAVIAGCSGWLATSIGMLGTAGWALYRSRAQPVKSITVAPAGLGASVSMSW